MKKLRIFTLALLLPAFVMTACDKGGDPAPPETPTPQMRYVSSISTNDDDGNGTSLFEYDSKNRLVKFTTEGGDLSYEWKTVASYTYDDVARTVAIKIEEEERYPDGHYFEYTDNQLFKLDANGNVISGEGTYLDNLTSATYADGYLNKLVFAHSSRSYEEEEEHEWQEAIAMTWSDGNKTRIVNSDNYDGEYEEGRTINLTYNPSWANNPQCNIDLNALSAPFDDGFGMSMLAEMIDLFGKRSRNMISGRKVENDVEFNYTCEITDMEYDTDGFVTKITEVFDLNGKTETSNITITYR